MARPEVGSAHSFSFLLRYENTHAHTHTKKPKRKANTTLKEISASHTQNHSSSELRFPPHFVSQPTYTSPVSHFHLQLSLFQIPISGIMIVTHPPTHPTAYEFSLTHTCSHKRCERRWKRQGGRRGIQQQTRGRKI